MMLTTEAIPSKTGAANAYSGCLVTSTAKDNPSAGERQAQNNSRLVGKISLFFMTCCLAACQPSTNNSTDHNQASSISDTAEVTSVDPETVVNPSPNSNALNTASAPTQSEAMADVNDPSQLEGCYTLKKDLPAQIKISQHLGNWVMQLKEPAEAKRVWDDPEPLLILPLPLASEYFDTKGKRVTALLGRDDRMFVIAKMEETATSSKEVSNTVNGMGSTADSKVGQSGSLSPYWGYIYQGGNRIYRVACDEVNIDLLKGAQATAPSS